MIMKKRFLILGIIFCSAWAISCEEDDVCVGEGTPFMTVVFRNFQNNANLTDSLTIIASKTPEFSEPDTVYYKELTDSVKLPLGGLDDDISYFKIRRRNSSLDDVLTVKYDTKSSYVSKACGFRVTYENLSYSTTNNTIEYLQPAESNIIENESITNLYIVFSN